MTARRGGGLEWPRVAESVPDPVPSQRGAVAVICPFAGLPGEADETLERLRRITRGEGDVLVLVDNSREQVLRPLSERSRDAVVVSAPAMQSSYYARNVGAGSVDAEWLLFLDADCVPSPDILDRYFAEPLPLDCGAVAGSVAGATYQQGLLSRYARDRGVLDQERFTHSERPFAATVNLLVRRSAWKALGGFCEGIRSGGDVDFTWRLQAAGWTLEFRPAALVEHVHRETLRGLVRQFVRYGQGRAWLQRRFPDAPRASTYARLLLAAPFLIAGHLATGRLERAAYRGLDVTIALANLSGRLLGNRARSATSEAKPGDAAIVTDLFPEEAALAVLTRLRSEGRGAWVEAVRRAPCESAAAPREVPVAYREDDGMLEWTGDLAWLAARRPLAVCRALLGPERHETPLRQLAPSARRLAARASTAIVSADRAEAADVRRLALLAGVPLQPLDAVEPVDAPVRPARG